MKSSARSIRCLLIAGALSLVLTEPSAARTFTNQKGQKIEADVKSVDGKNVVLDLSGKEFTIEIADLIEADQEFIRSWKKEPAKPSDERVKPGASIKLEFPELTPDRRGKPAEVNLRIPDNYDASKPVPLIAWMGGGDGGNNSGSCASLIDSSEFVMAGLPFPKGANNPAQANMVGEYDKIWKYHEAMLAKVKELIPNLDPKLRIIAGFSNGAHAINGILSEGEAGFRDFFNVYILIEGGNGDGRYSKVTERHIYVAWGNKGNTNAAGSEEVAQKARRARMIVVKHEMDGIGHTFPESEKQLVKKWLAETVIPSTRGAAVAAAE